MYQNYKYQYIPNRNIQSGNSPSSNSQYYANMSSGNYHGTIPSGKTHLDYGKNGQNDDRFLGAFIAPFLLGGVAGAALSPGFGFGGRPCCGPYPTAYPAPYPVPTPYPYPYPYQPSYQSTSYQSTSYPVGY